MFKQTKKKFTSLFVFLLSLYSLSQMNLRQTIGNDFNLQYVQKNINKHQTEKISIYFFFQKTLSLSDSNNIFPKCDTCDSLENTLL